MSEKAASVLKGVTAASLYIIVFEGLQIILSIAALLLAQGNEEQIINNATGVIMLLAYIASYLIYRASFYARGIKIQNEYTVARPSVLDIIFAFSVAIGFRAITSAYFEWADRIKVLHESIEDATVYDTDSMTVFSILLFVGIMYVLAPIFEEILFRGIVLRELSKIMPAPLAIVLQGIAFGVIHMLLVQSIFTAVLGIILGFLYYRTKKLSVTVTVHMVFNMSAIFTQSENFNALAVAIIGLVMVVVAVGMFVFLYRKKQVPAVR